ncbi:MAG: FHA domain-containing protein [Pseudomonadota bacterium]
MKKYNSDKMGPEMTNLDLQGPYRKLILAHAGQQLHEYPIEGNCLMIGRGKENDIRLPDKRVSRAHARILTSLGSSLIEDLNSTNGTFVNSKRISIYALQEEDVIKIGKYILSYKPNPDLRYYDTKSVNIKASQPDLDDVITKGKRVPVDITALDFETTSTDASQTNTQQSAIELSEKIMDSSLEKTSKKQNLDQVLKTLEGLLD